MPKNAPVVLAVSATHRDNSNTESMLLATLQPLLEKNVDVELVRLRQLCMNPCDGCERCSPANGCRFDDALTRLYPRIFSARAWIVASPEYWWNVSGHCKTFLDRLNGYWKERDRYFAGKKAVVLTCGGQPLERTGYAEKALETFFSKMHFDLVGSVRASADLPDEILAQPSVLAECVRMGEKLGLALETTRPVKEAP